MAEIAVPEVNIQDIFNLGGKVVVLAGGAGLLGPYFAAAVAAAGGSPVVMDLDGPGAASLSTGLSRRYGVPALGLGLDVGDEAALRSAFAEVRRLGPVHGLVNMVYAKPPGYYQSLESYSAGTWEAALHGSLTSALLCLRETLPEMCARGSGSIVNVGSIYGIVGPDQRIYEGLALTRWIATTYGHRGVRANCLTLGGVQGGQSDRFVERYSGRTPLGRMACPGDYTGALLLLLSEAGRYLTGANLVVDGGWSAW
ncbi:MAG: SDR family oxidoreductase [Deltaproteobacteria bacterium]|nr:SDR family oxidoreductase [Deltaproteobacteria bacterium]